MAGPAWFTASLAALMLLIAAYCTVRLVIWRLHGRHSELDVDGLHVVMGVAMAGMLEPGLSLVPDIVWRLVFTAAAAWFAGQALRARRRLRPGGWRSAHPAPHAVESAAMIYMLLPIRPPDHAHTMAMPGATGPAANPALALVLALFMLGYILWTTDQLVTLSRTKATALGYRQAPASQAATISQSAAASSTPARSQPATARASAVAGLALAPRLAACYKITMSVAMGYMLITML